MSSLKVGIVGAGAMGLAAAYHAARKGHQVSVFEAGAEPGGQAAHFDFGGLSLERFYHFICKSDQATFDLLRELKIEDRLRWRDTSMAYCIRGTVYPWGDPISLLRFPLLSWIEKFRYGLHMFLATKKNDWSELDRLTARQWLVEGTGERSYDLLWQELMEKKFHRYADDISAAWMWTRIKRLGTSRRSLFQEQLGYLEGGSQTLVDSLVQAIADAGGTTHLASPVEEVVVHDNQVVGIKSGGQQRSFDAVISTTPTPYIDSMVPALSHTAKSAYAAITNIGVVCVVAKLKRELSGHFWLNIMDPEEVLPGIVEFSALRPLEDTIVYAPFYMPPDHAEFANPDDWFIEQTRRCFQKVNPTFKEADIVDIAVARLKHAQPVCGPGFGGQLPAIQTDIGGLQIADTCFYYPEDRGISESVRLGKIMADNLG